MRLSEFGKSSLFLLRLAKAPAHISHDQRGVTAEQRTQCGRVVDIYRPQQKKGTTWIIVHGLTINGCKEPRLVHFAQSLARSGVTCMVPTLEGLAACRWDPSDVDALAKLVMDVAIKNNAPVGLLGFSYGGGYCLLAAARENTAKHVRQVIAVGAHHSLPALWETYEKKLDRQPGNDSEWDETIYRHLVMLYGYAPQTLLPPELRRRTANLLQRYCGSASIKEKKHFLMDISKPWIYRPSSKQQ